MKQAIRYKIRGLASLNPNLKQGKIAYIDDRFRPPMVSPRGHRDYNRMKYYSALKTGYKHLNKEEFLKIPKHVIDD